LSDYIVKKTLNAGIIQDDLKDTNKRFSTVGNKIIPLKKKNIIKNQLNSKH